MTPCSTGSSRPSGRAPGPSWRWEGGGGQAPGLSGHFSCRHRGTAEGSAVCVFSMKDVQRVFSGLYKEVNRETQQWYTVTYPVPTPRPGSVRTAPCTRVGCWEDGASPPARMTWLPQVGFELGDKSPGLIVPLRQM